MSEHQLTEVATNYTYTEGPRWHEGKLWFVDFYTHSVNRVEDDGSITQVATVEHQPSGLGWLPDGRMLVVSMKDRKVLRMEDDGSLVVHADISQHCNGPANDMVVAANGQAYIGEFGFDLMGGADYAHSVIILVNPDGSSRVVARDQQFPNGMSITEDGQTLLVNELFGNRVSQFSIKEDGSLGPRRDFAAFGELGDEPSVDKRLASATIVPDGQALDAEGAVWVADAVNQRAARLAEGGEILDEVSTAPNGVFAVALGGEDGKTLFLSVAPDFFEDKRSATREASLVSTKVDVPRAGRP